MVYIAFLLTRERERERERERVRMSKLMPVACLPHESTNV